MGNYGPPAAQRAWLGSTGKLWLRDNSVFFLPRGGVSAACSSRPKAQAVALERQMSKRRRGRAMSGGKDGQQSE